jgi:hypothetical protein
MNRNRVSRISSLAVLVLLLTLVGGATTMAQGPDTNDVVAVTVTSGRVSWQPQIKSGGYTLTISGPGDFYLSQTYQPGDRPVFRITDGEGKVLPSGVYLYEFRFMPEEKPDSNMRGLVPAVEAPSKSGSFSILDGKFVLQDEAEDTGIVVTSNDQITRDQVTLDQVILDQVILDDLIVDGSACIGLDCVNGESFGFDTLRLKENNLRIHFQDTSSSASFPTSDWRIAINDSANGGASYFAIQDVDAGRTVFQIEAGAGSNALYVDDYGRVGLGTSTPAVELEVRDSDTPSVRLNQDGSGGWAPQTWDVAGNEANFFIRDVTNGSQLPFRIKPGADSNSLYINSDNNIGIGTESPDAAVHVQRNSGTAQLLVEEQSSGYAVQLKLLNNGTPRMEFDDTSTANNIWNMGLDANSNFIYTHFDNSGLQMKLSPSGDLTIQGSLTTAVTNYPDYVFESDYDLMSLEDLQTFIEQENHLPNIDSVSEVEAQGGVVDMSTLQMQLLQKIEELTLYTLQQQQTIEELQVRLDALEGTK